MAGNKDKPKLNEYVTVVYEVQSSWFCRETHTNELNDAAAEVKKKSGVIFAKGDGLSGKMWVAGKADMDLEAIRVVIQLRLCKCRKVAIIDIRVDISQHITELNVQITSIKQEVLVQILKELTIVLNNLCNRPRCERPRCGGSCCNTPCRCNQAIRGCTEVTPITACLMAPEGANSLVPCVLDAAPSNDENELDNLEESFEAFALQRGYGYGYGYEYEYDDYGYEYDH